jgi:hypothetical protein
VIGFKLELGLGFEFGLEPSKRFQLLLILPLISLILPLLISI